MNEEARKRIQRARVQLTLDKRLVFFASLVLRLKAEECSTIPTACVDNVTMRYNPDFIMSLPPESVITLIAHETMHPALGHPWRLSGRDHGAFNAAADYVINGMLEDSGLPPLPHWLRDRKYDGMSAERVYEELIEQSEEKQEEQNAKSKQSAGECQEPQAPSPEEDTDGQPDDDGDTRGGDDSAPDNSGDATAAGDVPPTEPTLQDALESSDASEQDWKAAVAEAANAARAAGTLSLSMERFAEDVTQTRVNWRAELQQFVQCIAKADYTWYRPSSRYLPRGLFMPSLRSEQMPPIVVAIDTSGSVSNKELGMYAAEVNSAIDAVTPERVHVVYCDTRVQHDETFEAGEQVELHPHGGGGTRFSPVLEWVEAQGIQPAALIYFTDLWCSDFGSEPEYPTLWMTTDKRRTAPYGVTIPITEV